MTEGGGRGVGKVSRRRADGQFEAAAEEEEPTGADQRSSGQRSQARARCRQPALLALTRVRVQHVVVVDGQQRGQLRLRRQRVLGGNGGGHDGGRLGRQPLLHEL